MFSVDGYQPLQEFLNLAYKSINGRLEVERVKRVLKARDAGEERPQYPFAHFNAECAAEFAVYDFFAKSTSTAKCIQALSPDGLSRLNVPLNLIEPMWAYHNPKENSYYAARTSQARYVRSKFEVETLSQDYWIVPFLEEQCFAERGDLSTSLTRSLSKNIPSVDWRLGTFKLSVHKRYLNNMEKFRDGAEALARMVELPRSMLRYLEALAENRTYIKTLAPLDGYNIIAPNEWYEAFAKLAIGSSENAQPVGIGESTFDLILSLILNEKVIKRPSIRTQAIKDFGISGREFDRVWADIDEARPDLELSKPGPRSPRRNEFA